MICAETKMTAGQVCITIFIVILVLMGGITAVTSSSEQISYIGNVTINRLANFSSNYTDNFYDNETDFNETFRSPLSPICYLKPKGLSMTEIIALSMLENPPSQDNFSEGQWRIVDEFLSEKGEIG